LKSQVDPCEFIQHLNVGHLDIAQNLELDDRVVDLRRVDDAVPQCLGISPSLLLKAGSVAEVDRLRGIRPEIGCGYLWAPGPRAVRLVP